MTTTTTTLAAEQRRARAEAVATNLTQAVLLLKVAHTNMMTDASSPVRKDAITVTVAATVLDEIAKQAAAYAAGLAADEGTS